MTLYWPCKFVPSPEKHGKWKFDCMWVCASSRPAVLPQVCNCAATYFAHMNKPHANIGKFKPMIIDNWHVCRFLLSFQKLVNWGINAEILSRSIQVFLSSNNARTPSILFQLVWTQNFSCPSYRSWQISLLKSRRPMLRLAQWPKRLLEVSGLWWRLGVNRPRSKGTMQL